MRALSIAVLVSQLAFAASPTPTPATAPPAPAKPTATPAPAPTAPGMTVLPQPAEPPVRTLQDLARDMKLRRTPGAGRLSIQSEPGARADVRPAGGEPPAEEAPATASPIPRVSVVKAEYSAPDGNNNVPVVVTLSSGGPSDACSVAILVTLSADDGNALGSAQVVVDRIPKGLTTTALVSVQVPNGTRVEARGASFTLYSGFGAGKKLETASARLARPPVACP